MPVLPHIHSQSIERLFIVVFETLKKCFVGEVFVEIFKLLRYHLCDVTGLYFVVLYLKKQNKNNIQMSF